MSINDGSEPRDLALPWSHQTSGYESPDSCLEDCERGDPCPTRPQYPEMEFLEIGTTLNKF